MNRLIDNNERGSALVVLEDGTTLTGIACGAEGEVFGKLAVVDDIFAYQQSIEDPANEGKLLAFSYPQLGNHGVIAPRAEKEALAAAAVLTHDMVYTPSNWQSECSLPDYLSQHGVLAVEDLDMRALVVHLREHSNSMFAAVSTTERDAKALLERLLSAKEAM